MSIENKEYNVEFFSSMLSGKKKLLCNGSKIHEVKKLGSLTYPFTIGKKNAILITTGTDMFDLEIENEIF